MLQGTRLRLHKNSFVRVHGHDGIGVCTSYDPDKQKWCVVWPSLRKELLVAESALELSHTILPSSCGRLGCYQQFAFEATQGNCGRGIVANQNIKAGMPIFEEPPLFVVPSCENTSPLEHHAARWRAYRTLAVKASKDALGGVWAKAFAGFEELVASSPTNRLKDAARRDAAYQIALHEADASDEQARCAYRARVQATRA